MEGAELEELVPSGVLAGLVGVRQVAEGQDAPGATMATSSEEEIVAMVRQVQAVGAGAPQGC